MRIRRFTAPTATEALRLVGAALGPEAVLLETTTDDGQVTITAATDVAAPAEADELVHEARALAGTLLAGRREGALDPRVDALRALHRDLVARGTDGVIAAALVRATAAAMQGGRPLAAALGRTLAGAGAGELPRVVVLVGPPGDGKTTTLAKLAVCDRRAGRRVLLVAADTHRVGAAAELDVVGRALGAAVERAPGPDALAAALAAADADRILVDTAGVVAGDAAELAALAALTAAAGDASARVLVVSATSAPGVVARTCAGVAPLAPTCAAVTKADLAPPGPVVGALWARDVRVGFLADGRRVGADIAAASPERLARCLLAA